VELQNVNFFGIKFFGNIKGCQKPPDHGRGQEGVSSSLQRERERV
jgi:hypothetical protein